MAKHQDQRQAELIPGEDLDPLPPDFVNALDPVQQPVAAKKLHWRVAAALRQMSARREQLLEKRALLNKEIEELDAAILALE